MSQVRKDILNGWKEIGRYVGRDTRTVERWEKLRGLPVRRLPGEGRASVYALTSELDEWLENSKREAAEVTTLVPLAAAPEVPPQSEAALPQHEIITPEPATPTRAKLIDIRSAAAALKRPPTSATTARAWIAARSPRSIAGIAVAIAVSLVCVFASPALRSHANPAAASLKFTPDPGEKITESQSRSRVSGVDELYLQGIYFYEQRTPESLERARDNFSAAIERDPAYAPAYAALANTYNLLREYSVMPDEEAYPKARAAAEHAVALDPNLPDAHSSLGFIDFFWQWDTTTAEREFKTALALDPTSVLAHHWYGSMLTHEGRYAEALDQLNQAQRLEPASAAILSTRALALGLSGHRVEAVDMLQNLISDTPGVSSPHAILSTLSRVEPQDPARFVSEMHRSAELRHSDELLQVSTDADTALRSGGDRAMWSAILNTEERLHPGPANRTYLMAEAETALGHNDAAFDDLQRLYQRRDPTVMGIILDPTLAPLREDKRYHHLVAAIGLPTPH